MDSKDREFIMNSKQLKVFWIAIILITLMAIFPPWVGTKRNQSEEFIGFHFIFSQPRYKVYHRESYNIVNGKKEVVNPKSYYSHHDYTNSRIDPNRFFIQIIPFILITGGLMYTWKGKNINKIKDDSTPVIGKNYES